MHLAFAAVLMLAVSGVSASEQTGSAGQMNGPMKGQTSGPMGVPMRSGPMAMPMLPAPPPAVPPRRLTKAIELLTVSGTHELIDGFIQRVRPMAMSMAQRQLKPNDVGAQRDVTAATNVELKNGEKEILENTARVYAGHFSDIELDALTAFFKTPAEKNTRDCSRCCRGKVPGSSGLGP